MRNAKTILFIVSFFLIILVLIFPLTTKGSAFVMRLVLERGLGAQNISFSNARGSLLRGFTVKQLELRDLRMLPYGTVLKVQTFSIRPTMTNLVRIYCEFISGRIVLPNGELVLFTGTYRGGVIDFDVYTKEIDLRELDEFLPPGYHNPVSGSIHDVDVTVSGLIDRLHIVGGYSVSSLTGEHFLLTDTIGTLDMTVKNAVHNAKLGGSVTINTGVFLLKGLSFAIKESSVFFEEKILDSNLAIKASTVVDGVNVDITLKGTINEPTMTMVSDPPLSQEKITMLLLTRRRWDAVDFALKGKPSQTDMAKNFVDYFLFNGTASKMARWLGISDVYIEYDGKTKGVGAGKRVNDTVELNYFISQDTDKKGTAQTTQKVGGEVHVTKEISIYGKKEILNAQNQDPSSVPAEGETQPDDSVFIKYEKAY